MKLFVALLLLQSLMMLQACTGGSFHLRKNIDLPKSAQKIQLANLSSEHGLYKAIESALEEAGGSLSENASTIINIRDLREDKRVVSYTSERKVREYLVFLKFDYSVQSQGKKSTPRQRVRLDQSFIYDANFALGKAEEEDKIRQDLEREAARIILLRLQYMSTK